MAELVKHLACSNCRTTFDEHSRQPLSLICGHVVCRKCLSSNIPFTCPRDNTVEKRKIEAIPVADLILEMLRSIDTPPSWLCSLHSRTFEFFCNECSVLFCPKCVMTHRQHDYIEVEQANQLVQSIRSRCQEAILEAETQYQTTKQRLEEIKEARELNESNQCTAIMNLEAEFENLTHSLELQYLEDEARLIRESFPLKNYIDQHDEHQRSVLKDQEKDMAQAEKIRAELVKCDSHISVLAKLDLFSYKPMQLDNFTFDFGGN